MVLKAARAAVTWRQITLTGKRPKSSSIGGSSDVFSDIGFYLLRLSGFKNFLHLLGRL